MAAEASVGDVARRHDVHLDLLHLWRKQARTGVLGDERAVRTANGGWVSSAAVTGTGVSTTCGGSSGGMIEIELACGARLRRGGAAEPAPASAVVAVVAGRRR
jgi:hypothetical protein